jgi:hypothetical protein
LSVGLSNLLFRMTSIPAATSAVIPIKRVDPGVSILLRYAASSESVVKVSAIASLPITIALQVSRLVTIIARHIPQWWRIRRRVPSGPIDCITSLKWRLGDLSLL